MLVLLVQCCVAGVIRWYMRGARVFACSLLGCYWMLCSEHMSRGQATLGSGVETAVQELSAATRVWYE